MIANIFVIIVSIIEMIIVSAFILQFRLVTKTALKLLLVFVEYAEANALVFVQAVHSYHTNTRK